MTNLTEIRCLRAGYFDDIAGSLVTSWLLLCRLAGLTAACLMLSVVSAVAQDLQKTIGEVTVTVTDAPVSAGAQAAPALRLDERGEEIQIHLRNTGSSRTRVGLNIWPVEVWGFDPAKAYFSRGASIPLDAGEATMTSLPFKGGLIPGRWRVEVKVSNTLGSIPVTIEPENPMARPLDDRVDEDLGPNVALSALGGQVEATSEWDKGWTAEQLIDGITWTRKRQNSGQCQNCGWAGGKEETAPEITVSLAGERPVEIATVVLDTRRFWASGRNKSDVTKWQPKNVAISVSPDGQGGFTEVARARLHRDFLRQAIDLPAGTVARMVRVNILDSFNGEPGISFVELEVREASDANPSVTEEIDVDLARAALGGALVRYSGYSDDRWGARLFDGQDTQWISHDSHFPQDFTLAFRGDESVLIDRVELTLADERRAKRWPSEVAVATSEHHPLDGFVEVARMRLDQRAGRHAIPIGRQARFVKVRILDNHGDKVTALAGISVIERKGDGKSVLSGPPGENVTVFGDSTPDADMSESEPNDTMDSANPLEFGRTMEGRIDPLGEIDYFALPDFAPGATALTLDYKGRPNIRHRLSLIDSAGEVLSSFDPGDLPASDAMLSFRITGRERYLQLSEPPASVVVIWDTSGSMKGSEKDLEKAVRQYIRSAPDSQQIRLVRFSKEVETLGEDFTGNKMTLEQMLGGNFQPNGGTRLYDAIIKGLDLLRDRSGNRAIVLMTDGNDTSRTWLGEVWSGLEQNRIRLYTIGMGEGLQEYSEVMASTGRRMLGHLSMATDGRSYFAADSTALDRFYRQISEELASPATYFLKPFQETGVGSLELVAVGEEIPGAALPAVHLIFDVSGSMAEKLPDGKTRIDAAKAAMFEALEGLPAGAPFGLTVYGAKVPERPDKELACADIETVQELGPLRKDQVRRYISQLRPKGGTTPLAASVAHVFNSFADDRGGIIIAITDGIEECDPEPLVTVKDLAKRNVDLELNLIGFDLRQEETRAMMRDLAAAGRGRYFDAKDGAAVAGALQDAMAAAYVIRDASGADIGQGKVGGEPVDLPPGSYEVIIQASDGAIRTRSVRIAEDMLTTVVINKAGGEVTIDVGSPRKVDPLVACGEPAAGRSDQDRVRRIQERLNEVGFDAGRPDNMVGPGTRRAIAEFLGAHGLDIEVESTILVEQHLDCVALRGKPYRGGDGLQ